MMIEIRNDEIKDEGKKKEWGRKIKDIMKKYKEKMRSEGGD